MKFCVCADFRERELFVTQQDARIRPRVQKGFFNKLFAFV